MRPASLAIALLIVSAAFQSPAEAQEPTLPMPPRQAEPWTPPRTSLPKFLISATAALYDQGLADPRGCDYRKIKIAIGSVWGGGAHEIETSGWVLPTVDGSKPRHAIAWSGLVYPLTGVGGPADIDADVRALEDAAGNGLADVAPKDRAATRTGFHGFGTNNEGSSIAVATLQPIKICMLLRLGRADLAEAAWSAGTGLPKGPKPVGPGPKLDLNTYGVSYLSLATDLAWYHFDRAICAHMRGDDPLALADARFLDAFARDVDARAEAMGFDRPDRQAKPGRATPYIDFLEQVPRLLADHERRARERANPPGQPRGAAQEARVAALIRDLDQVSARRVGPARRGGPGRVADHPGVDRRGGRRRRAADPGLPDRGPPDPFGRLPSRLLPEPDDPRRRPGRLYRPDRHTQVHELRPAGPGRGRRRAEEPEGGRRSDTGVLGQESSDPCRRAMVSDPGRRRGRRRGLAGGVGQHHPARETSGPRSPAAARSSCTETSPIRPGERPPFRGESLRKRARTDRRELDGPQG